MIGNASELRQVKVGDFICLTDEQTIKDLMKRKSSNAEAGLKMEITRIRRVTEQNMLCRWVLCDLAAPGESDLTLVLKLVADVTDIRIYFRPDDMPIATRGDLLNQDRRWLFQAPTNVDSYVPADLKYTLTVEQNTDEGPATYTLKIGEFHGECVETPKPSGISQPVFTTVVEYFTPTKVQNPELLILEIGGIDDTGKRISEGGVITFLQGGPIQCNDITLFAR